MLLGCLCLLVRERTEQHKICKLQTWSTTGIELFMFKNFVLSTIYLNHVVLIVPVLIRKYCILVIPVINISGLLHVDKGHSINLVCNASGTTAPPELMQWFKDGLEVMASSRVLIREQYSVTSRTITSWLEIKQAQLEDKGTYTCRASDLQVTSVDVNVLNGKDWQCIL